MGEDPGRLGEELPRLPARDPRRRVSCLAGRRALVVGGSGGIGAEVSRALAARGSEVLVHGRDPGRVAALVAALRSEGREATGLAQDIARPSDIIDRLPGLGRIDILVVSFGPFVRKPVAQTATGDWERVALLDLALPGALASALFPEMARRGWGRMLFFGGSRTDGIRAYKSNAAYAAAKTGLAVVAKSIAAEGARHGVSAVLVCPGLVDSGEMSDPERKALEAMAPAGRLIAPADIAGAALDLLDAEPCIASGAVVSLDSGFLP